MARVLLYARPERVESDPELARMVWRRGHVVCVRPDGWQWSDAEAWPDFIRLDLPGVPVEAVKHWEDEQLDPVEEGRVLRRRRYRWRVDAMPRTIRKQMAQAHGLSVGQGHKHSWAQVRGFLRDDHTGLDEARDL